MKILYFERMEPPSLLVARIADPSPPSADVTYRIAPAAGGTQVTITGTRSLQPLLPVHVALVFGTGHAERVREEPEARRS